MNSKICSCCKTEKSILLFAKRADISNVTGLPYRKSKCKKCTSKTDPKNKFKNNSKHNPKSKINSILKICHLCKKSLDISMFRVMKRRVYSDMIRLEDGKRVRYGQRVIITFKNHCYCHDCDKMKRSEWAVKNKSYCSMAQKKRRAENIDKYRAIELERSSKSIALLSDGYVKRRLELMGFPIITKELIEIKRVQLKAKRLIKI